MAEGEAGAPSRSLNAAAPAPLRLILEFLDRLSRFDGWLGAMCLASLTALMLAEVFVRAVSNFRSSRVCVGTFRPRLEF